MKTLRVALLTLFVQAVVSAQQPSPAAIRGVVVKWGSVNPVSQAIVELRAETGGRPIASTATLDNGAFSFPSVAPGRYRVIATRAGFASGEFGQRRPGGSGQAISLSPGQQKAGVQIGMSEGATVFGRILDRSGQPLPFAEVRIQRVDHRTGRPGLVDIQTAVTNDLGEYRIFWITPGQYYVCASANNNQTFGGRMLVNPNGADTSGASFAITTRPTASVTRMVGLEEGESFVPIYYPATPDIQSASLVDLRAGTEMNANFTIIPVRTRQVRGVVVDQTTGQPVQAMLRVSIYPLDRYMQPGGTTLQFNPNNGIFQFSGMRPGTYELSALVGDLAGRTIIDVPDRDVDVTLRVMPVIKVTGKVSVEGRSTPGGPLQIATRGTLAQPGAVVSDTGEFEIPKVPVGSYQFGVMPFSPLPELPTPAGAAPGQPPRPRQIPAIWQDAYVKSIKIGDRDIFNRELVVEGQSLGPIEIVVGVNGTSIEGRALNEKQEPVANAMVVLIPDSAPPIRPDRVRSAATDESGQFQLRGVAPGDYIAYAWEDVDPGAWFSPVFMRLYENAGQKVRIGEAQKQTVEIRAIPVR
jgi:hypothetical protein